MEFRNDYEDLGRAAAYDQLQFANTYQLAFRDLPTLYSNHVAGDRALDFGCGTGRSTRFLKHLGFDVIGVDISTEMVAVARRNDPGEDYRVIEDGGFGTLPCGTFDLIQSAFTFDNIPGREHKIRLFRELGRLLTPMGRLVNIVSTPEMYLHEWVTFTTRDYPENRNARCGDVVHIRTVDYSDPRPVADILWTDAGYRDVYHQARLECLRYELPLARGDEGIDWVTENEVAPWAIYVLGRLEIESDRYGP